MKVHNFAKLSCVVVFSAAAVMPAVSHSQDSGFYAGLGVGQVKAKNACDTSGLPAGATITSCDDNDTTGKIYLGYQINRNWGVEVGYVAQANFKASGNVLGIPLNANVDADAWQLAGVGKIPLGPQFELFGKLGVVRAKVNAQASAGGISASASDSSTRPMYGLVLNWNFARNWAARIEWEQFNDVGGNNTGKSDVDFFSAGILVRF